MIILPSRETAILYNFVNATDEEIVITNQSIRQIFKSVGIAIDDFTIRIETIGGGKSGRYLSFDVFVNDKAEYNFTIFDNGEIGGICKIQKSVADQCQLQKLPFELCRGNILTAAPDGIQLNGQTLKQISHYRAFDAGETMKIERLLRCPQYDFGGFFAVVLEAYNYGMDVELGYIDLANGILYIWRISNFDYPKGMAIRLNNATGDIEVYLKADDYITIYESPNKQISKFYDKDYANMWVGLEYNKEAKIIEFWMDYRHLFNGANYYDIYIGEFLKPYLAKGANHKVVEFGWKILDWLEILKKNNLGDFGTTWFSGIEFKTSNVYLASVIYAYCRIGLTDETAAIACDLAVLAGKDLDIAIAYIGGDIEPLKKYYCMG